MLISVLAVTRTRGRIAGERLGLTQLQAWQDITGLQDDRIGEEILLLSSSADEDFMQGCRNASHFVEALHGRLEAIDLGDARFLEGNGIDTLVGNAATDGIWDSSYGSNAGALWIRYFEGHLDDNGRVGSY